ncbi:protein kinase [Hamiltosporidium tvaerminnensis]|uniref:Protein kinase n=2 Tax=Hamiltosporidium TaxID=1176354 RepID=A0A4Q9L9J1_9MICR|nr:hypothetical protein LUQ84_002177 [Hamiltosporidium tvaerminnensis]TBU03972.1 protein kinase [Hamiltosporidium magnivora]TBU04368.1 protein kinase [Hamiltosporidium tvaerminnensis]TBU11984.1 protein kinase [Hamiltosporidium tvaerminnensis]
MSQEIKEFGDYSLVCQLGVGRFGRVYEYIDRVTEKRVAIKFVSKYLISFGKPDFIPNEIKAYQFLGKHPNILEFYGYTELEEEGVFILEYFNGYSLQRVLYESRNHNKRPEVTNSLLKGYVLQLIDAVKFIHSHCIYHCDLRPENVLVNNSKIKIVDFGCALFGPSVFASSRQTLFSGSANFLPPEALSLSKDSEFLVLKPCVDVWAIGCLIFYMYTGELPFNGLHYEEALTQVRNLQVDFKGLPSFIKPICQSIFQADFYKRPNLEELEVIVMDMIPE